jgi:hypothetical protein
MAFTRDQLSDYEKGPQKKIDDKVNPFRGATPAKVASSADLSVPTAPEGAQSTLQDAAEGSVPAAAARDNDAPIVDEDGSLTGDPTESGEGTSDEPVDSSTTTDDPSVESDPNADLTGEPEQDAAPAPKKGSAAERIVEVLDLMEGYKIYGKAKEEQVQALQTELDRLRGQTQPVVPVIVEDKDERMPDMADEDIAFDNDKYREKMAAWVKAQGRIEARRELRAASEVQAQRSVSAAIEAKAAAFEKDHPDFATKVRTNKVLASHQLHPFAGRLVGKSEYTAELLYAFGSDTAMAIRVAQMDPEDQISTIHDMIAKIKAEKKAAVKTPTSSQPQAKLGQKKSITQAPPPPRATLAGGSAQARDPLDPSTSMDDFARQHRAGKQSTRESNRKQRGLN